MENVTRRPASSATVRLTPLMASEPSSDHVAAQVVGYVDFEAPGAGPVIVAGGGRGARIAARFGSRRGGERLPCAHGAGGVDVALYEVAVQAAADRQRPLQVDPVAHPQRAQGGLVQGGAPGLHDEPVLAAGHHGLAHAVHGHRCAGGQVVEQQRAADRKPHPAGRARAFQNGADFFDDSRKHGLPHPARATAGCTSPAGSTTRRSAPRSR